MRWGAQKLEAVVAEAAACADQLDADFAVPVFLVLDADEGAEGPTVVTAAARGAAKPHQFASVVVPLQARFPKPGKDLELAFGRSAVCDVVLPWGSVSKHHGTLRRSALGWQLIDVGSSNGTTLGGRAVPALQPQYLPDGAVLTVGLVAARFLDGPAFAAFLRQQLAARSSRP